MNFEEVKIILEQNEKFEAYWITPKGKKISLGAVSYDDGDYYHADLVEGNLQQFGFSREWLDNIYDEEDDAQEAIVEAAMKAGGVRSRGWDTYIDVEFCGLKGKKNTINHLLNLANDRRAVRVVEYTNSNVNTRKFNSVKEAVNYLVN